MASSVQATRLRKGMLIKQGNDLFRIMELHHLTPGNKRAHIQARMRNIRSGALADHKFRAEEDVERAVLDEREMQYLYNDGDHYYFMDTSTYEQIHISAEAMGDSKDYIIPDAIIRVEFYDVEPVGIELPPTVDLRREGNRARHQGRHGERAGQARDARDRPRRAGAAVRQRRRQSAGQYRNGRVSVTGVEELVIWESGNLVIDCGLEIRLGIRSTNQLPHQLPDSQFPNYQIQISMDVVRTSSAPRLDRSRHRQHVQRQERGAHPPAAQGADREAEGPDLQAAHRQPLQRRPHRLAQRDADCVGEREVVRRAADAGARRHRGRRHRRGAVLRRRICRPRATRSPIAASASSSPDWIRTTSAARSSRCRSCSRSPSTSPRRSRSASSAAIRRTTPSGWSRARIACSSARSGLYEARCRHCFDPHLADAEQPAPTSPAAKT